MEFWCEIGAADGNVEYAVSAARVAAASGASALKVQWLDPDTIFTRDAPRYDNTSGDWTNQYDGYRGKTLTPREWTPVIEQCEALDLEFIPAVFSPTLAATAKTFGIKHVKVASGDITFFELIHNIGLLGFPKVTISTGASTLEEIKRATTWLDETGWNGELTLLACHLQYPTSVMTAHLGRIIALRSAYPFPTRIGLSDHTPGIDTIPVALSFGAQVIEKHFSLHPHEGGGDHDFAISPEELSAGVQLSQYLIEMIGNVEIEVSPGEAAARDGARRSLYAARDLSAGDRIAEGDMIALRPVLPDAIEAWEYKDFVGKKLHADVTLGDPILRTLVGGVGASLTVA